MRAMRHLCVGLLASSLAAGCLSDEVDEADAGIFACEDVEDCGEDEFCVLGRCEVVEPPSVLVRDPEPFEVNHLSELAFIIGHASL